MTRFSATDSALVEKLAGQKIFDWERLAEEHSAVSRTDPNAYAEAWQEYATNALQMGTVPRREYKEFFGGRGAGPGLPSSTVVRTYMIAILESMNTQALRRWVGRTQCTS